MEIADDYFSHVQQRLPIHSPGEMRQRIPDML
jgi:hypothetical protein